MRSILFFLCRDRGLGCIWAPFYETWEPCNALQSGFCVKTKALGALGHLCSVCANLVVHSICLCTRDGGFVAQWGDLY